MFLKGKKEKRFVGVQLHFLFRAVGNTIRLSEGKVIMFFVLPTNGSTSKDESLFYFHRTRARSQQRARRPTDTMQRLIKS